PADLIFPSSFQMGNGGEMLILCSPYNVSADNCKPSTINLYDKVVDVVNTYENTATATPTSSTLNPWPAGTTSWYGTMERKNLISNEDTNWFTHPDGGKPRNGIDANGNPINGTPKESNWAFEVTATPRPTATPTRTRTPLAIPGPVLVLNEFLVRPGHDWNNDGAVNVGDEFIEVINAGTVDVNLSGYKLDVYREDASGNELKNGISLISALRPGDSSVLKPGEMRVFFASASGIYLRDSGDTVRLLKSSNYTVVDAYTYPPARSLDLSWCRYTDGYGDWVGRCFPTPNQRNSLTGSLFPPDPGAGSTRACLLPDSAPAEIVMAECEEAGLDIWNPFYWDSFPGEWSEHWLWELFGKWLVIFQ
ncbi:MAG: lamin tail domain-containing protein, partial [Chloroflexota bacterium]